MKKVILILVFLFSVMIQGQDSKLIPQISVSGEGKIKVIPDKAVINFGVENSGKDAAEVKKSNDEVVDNVLKFIKKFGILSTDVQTTQLSLHRSYDYDKKKYSFQTSQSITIILKDLTKYDALMMGLIDNGINTITNVVFESSKIEEYKSEARRLAIKDAKHRAEDYTAELGQKTGKALLINDVSSSSNYPQPMYKAMAFASADESTAKQTLAIGEIEVSANVSVSFLLD